MENEDPFYLGLTMAGAVSAGAYTAGVMDFLIEALDEWENRKGLDNVPTHRVKIPVIGGASAGGMTGIITASAIHNKIEPVRELGNNILAEQPRNKFYHSWVDLIREDMFPLMLDNADISEGKIYSLLNSQFIDEVASRAIHANSEAWVQRPYFEEHLKIFVTLSSLQGICFNVGFRGGIKSTNYYISRHSDYAAFILNRSDEHYASDGWIPLDFRNNVNINVARDAAMATGAFPLGLRSRKLSRLSRHVNELSWHKDITGIQPIEGDSYETLNVDGGLINNEPFEKVRDVLKAITGQTKPEEYQDYNKFRSTILMIDPFPSELEKLTPGEELFGVAASTFSAMIGHLRTKPAEIEKALQEENAGQFLIAPSRKRANFVGNIEKVEGSKAIACGSLGGFGGFLHKEFRIHDFFLGRANCEQFLREYLTVPVNSGNPIFRNGYDQVHDLTPYLSKDGRLPVIPLFSPPKPSPYLPLFENGSDWPLRREQDIDRFKKPLKQRAGKIIMNLSDYSTLEKILIGIGNRVVLRGKLANGVLNSIRKSLKEHELLA